MRVMMLTGSYPPDPCGIGDYTQRLQLALETVGVNVQLLKESKWRLRDVPDLARQVRRCSPDLVHIQYPTLGYGYHIGPQGFSIVQPSVVTLHEVSQAKFLRQLSLIPFGIRSSRIIFTSSFERNYAVRLAPWVRSRSCVIPIGSNVPASLSPERKQHDRVIYFGLIRPKRGLEDYLAFVRLACNTMSGVEFNVVGRVDVRHNSYYREVRSTCGDLPVHWILDSDLEALGKIFSSAKVAYVPYPDGASERRGSLLALLASGVATVTTSGKFTTRELAQAVLIGSSPAVALERVGELLKNDVERAGLCRRAWEYIRSRSWESIARLHLALYSQVTGA